ncbi:hypothetical protein [Streptomyces sp. NPDC060031]|uniref:hypothetical protein n=1 Tax=Streptomyces sp. NPDC060031 TaxID=3347043 RepID=UPI003680E848
MDEAKAWSGVLDCIIGGESLAACRKKTEKKDGNVLEDLIDENKDTISLTNQGAGATVWLAESVAAGCAVAGQPECVGPVLIVGKFAAGVAVFTRVPMVVNACGSYSSGAKGCTEQVIGLVGDVVAGSFIFFGAETVVVRAMEQFAYRSWLS